MNRYDPCLAWKCGRQCHPGRFLCHRHWRLVPLSLRRELWRHGMGPEPCPIGPRRVWAVLARQAVVAVGKRDGFDVPEVHQSVVVWALERLDAEIWRTFEVKGVEIG